MTIRFGNLPPEVVDFIRSAFTRANQKVSAQYTLNPNLTEPYLDQTFLTELSAQPKAFFANSLAVLAIETHWLGSRAMQGRHEVADLAVVIKLKASGAPITQKVALFQTKRLYARNSPKALDWSSSVATKVPLTPQRSFAFFEENSYAALTAQSQQVTDIDTFTSTTNIPVYYGLYNSLEIPYAGRNPPTYPRHLPPNEYGFRIIPASNVHAKLASITRGHHPSLTGLRLSKPLQPSDRTSTCGWRIENFIADEVLACHQGALFNDNTHPKLQRLIDTREGPLLSLIEITVDAPSD